MKMQKRSKGFSIVEARPNYPSKDFIRDPAGYYVLIKPYFDIGMVGLAVVNKKHELVKEFRGRRAADVSSALFSYEEENKLEWFSRKEHIAYIGSELKKAEIALVLGCSAYFQE